MFVRMFVDVFVVRMIFETTTLCDLDATLAMDTIIIRSVFVFFNKTQNHPTCQASPP